MADNVQWLKIKVGMFDGNSFKKIKRAKIGGVSYRDKLTAVWFELLDLAGKSNSNGYLIDNNEIPYHSFEDIAIMLDREEKEIELCMQFFINEKMVEIVDDIYCLTNFVKYQNEDGLQKIREQKRIAQAKWRERRKQGLIDFVDKKTSTVESTNNLLSYSISNSNINNIYKQICDYLNEKAKTNYRPTTKNTISAINARLKDNYTLEDFKTVIDKKCDEWLGTDMEKYLTPDTLFRPSNFEKYLNQKIIKKNKAEVDYKQHEYSNKEMSKMFDNLEEVEF